MDKNIRDLPADICRLLEAGSLTEDGIKEFAQSVEALLLARFTKSREPATLRMSNLGEPCEKKLWYKINTPDDGEPLAGQTLLKFLYGDLVGLLIPFLAKEAGYRVEGQEDELSLEGIKGHRDVVINGMLADVKTTSGYGHQKFENHKLEEDDPFGYLVQLGSYLKASASDPIVTNKTQAAFIAINKENGAIVVDQYEFKESNVDIPAKKAMLAEVHAPSRSFADVPDGASGNRKLSTNCSYCQFKDKCWPNLRKFAYSGGPRFLTKVVRLPDVSEIR